MSRVTITDYSSREHRNPMRYVDDAQAERHAQTNGLSPYKVCLVDVCGFRFEFHSVAQLELCLTYYRRPVHRSSRLPFRTGNLGGDHWESLRWFEKLPIVLLSNAKRPKVVAALERALVAYRAHPGTITSTDVSLFREEF